MDIVSNYMPTNGETTIPTVCHQEYSDAVVVQLQAVKAQLDLLCIPYTGVDTQVITTAEVTIVDPQVIIITSVIWGSGMTHYSFLGESKELM